MVKKNFKFLALLLLCSRVESRNNQEFEYTTTTEDLDSQEDNKIFIDNRIDEAPTYVPPAEKLIKSLVQGLGILIGQNNESIERRSGMEKVIAGITRPITNIFKREKKIVEHEMENVGFGEILNSIKDHFTAVYPGTLWCGAGHTASNPEEVGFFKITDACCRNHDNCNDSIQAGRSNRGLRNDGVFTRSHCSCDREFYDCLKDAHSVIATKIGITYFNILRPQCFKEEYPASCHKYGHFRIARSKCKEYEMDTSKNMTMQWFDIPDF